MSDFDYNINLLFGSPIPIENKFKVKQFTLNEIRNTIGFSRYYQFLNILCIDKISIKIALNTLKNVNGYEFIVSSCFYDVENRFTPIVCEGLSLFLGELVYFDRNVSRLHTENAVVGMLDFEDIVSALKKTNYIHDECAVDIQNEKHLQHMIDSRKAKAKYSQGSKNDLSDVVSAICAKHPNINLNNVGNLTIYQLMNQFARINAIEKYSIGIDSLIHGADKKDVNLIHWSEKV